MSWNDKILIVGFKLKDLFSINKQITIINIIMKTEAKVCIWFS